MTTVNPARAATPNGWGLSPRLDSSHGARSTPGKHGRTCISAVVDYPSVAELLLLASREQNNAVRRLFLSRGCLEQVNIKYDSWCLALKASSLRVQSVGCLGPAGD